MSNVGEIERATQNRIVRLFRDHLGYQYLGNWEDRVDNSNLEEGLLRDYLIKKAGYPEELVKRAIYKLQTEARNYDRNLYNNNKEVYKLLRYGVEVAANPGEKYQRVHLINWAEVEKNDFALAEEVTVLGFREKRPDIVLYINGIALGIIELKRSTVSIGDGIRQNLTNQKSEFIESFFSTVQLVMAGNDTEGLRYGTIGTPEKFFLGWKEDVEDNNSDFLEIHQTIVRRLSKKNDKGLVLLHGKPGTGKTSYIRYLISSLKKNVIFLPPNMAGAITNPDLISILIDNPNSVFIIEDAENIVVDRDKDGHSPVSALLNISDGLLSDCLNIQIICSFNTDISKVDNALMRKGRLIAKYEFKDLEASKAQALSTKLGFKIEHHFPTTLTAIYNQEEMDFQQSKKRNTVGFH